MRQLWAAALAAVALAACASTPPAKPRPPASHGRPPPHPPKPPVEKPPAEVAPPRETPPPSRPKPLSNLKGWDAEDHAAALEAFQAGCGVARDGPSRNICARARAMGRPGAKVAKEFFEDNFRAEEIPGAGVLTAYFAPEYDARTSPDREFSAPVRPKPAPATAVVAAPPPPAPANWGLDPLATLGNDDPGAGDAIGDVLDAAATAPPTPLPPTPGSPIQLATADRAVIENSPSAGALAWMRPEDLFFLQIQGSGSLRFPDGRRLKALYSGDNGKPFVAIARPMVNNGILAPNKASGDGIRSWLADHRGPEADAVMRLNPRYVFFNLATDDGLEPAGAAGVPLPAARAIAIDPSQHAYGEVFWIDAEAPVLAGAMKLYRRMVVALDTGSAIRGEIRADLYIGRGAEAGAEAGRVRHTLRMVRLVPVDAP
jgi:membrane-bound lytic murein transglycosylase A